jgi:hypothetical protein
MCLNNTPETAPCDASNTRQQWWVHVWADNTRELKNASDLNCLDDSATYHLRTYPCNASPCQSWYVQWWADGTIELKNQATGLCLDETDTYYMGVTETKPCNGSPWQRWR